LLFQLAGVLKGSGKVLIRAWRQVIGLFIADETRPVTTDEAADTAKIVSNAVSLPNYLEKQQCKEGGLFTTTRTRGTISPPS
jgi:hypothetical protein